LVNNLKSFNKLNCER